MKIVHLFVAALALSPLNAATLKVTGSGTFRPDAPNTLWTAPGQPWIFSFLVSSNPAGSNVEGLGFDTAYTAFTYYVGGNIVFTTPQFIRLDDVAASEGVNMKIDFQRFDDFPDAFPDIGFFFFGPQMFTGSTSSPTIVPGVYPDPGTYHAHVPGFYIHPYTRGTLTQLHGYVITVTVVPEPIQFWPLLFSVTCIAVWKKKVCQKKSRVTSGSGSLPSE